MALNTSSTGTVFTMFESVLFITDIVGRKEIYFGDGTTELFDGDRVRHTYKHSGTFKACVKLCKDELFETKNSTYVTAKHFVKEGIMISPPLSTDILSASASEDSAIYEVGLSSVCEPPLEVELFVNGTISEYGAFVDGAKPRHYFSKDGIPLESTTITLDNPSSIYVGGDHVGYHDKFCFSYYDDYSGVFDIKAVLKSSCNLCRDKFEDLITVSLTSIECTTTEIDENSIGVWGCDPDAKLYRTLYSPNTNSIATSEVGTDLGSRIAGISYNPNDGLIYGIYAGRGALVVIDPSTGGVTDLTNDLFVNNTTSMGFINPTDDYYYCRSEDSVVWSVINLDTLTIVRTFNETAIRDGKDIAYDVFTSKIWYMTGNDVHSVDVNNGAVTIYSGVIDETTSPDGGVSFEGVFGGVVSDATGYVAGIEDATGNVYTFRPEDLINDPDTTANYVTTITDGYYTSTATASVGDYTGMFNGYVVAETNEFDDLGVFTQNNICSAHLLGTTTRVFTDFAYITTFLDVPIVGIRLVLDKFDGDIITYDPIPPKFQVDEVTVPDESIITVTSNIGDMTATEMSESLRFFKFTSNGTDQQNRTLRVSVDTGFGYVETTNIEFRVEYPE